MLSGFSSGFSRIVDVKAAPASAGGKGDGLLDDQAIQLDL
jgi:hypothetical protein